MRPSGGVLVELKDGRKYCGPLWAWRPSEGWFSLVLDEPDAPDEFFLKDVVSAVDLDQRVEVNEQRDVDLLDRAKEEGWVQ